ncbi:hypothetical protein HAX54_007138 [Datura stramonium]|uniref:Uncharacterized protein n=1 Tax=Datura stramonium TaxID=4076 RepID=A0ABS8WXN7_DATST|nr:hypothetical protein [Datura stramonium]
MREKELNRGRHMNKLNTIDHLHEYNWINYIILAMEITTSLPVRWFRINVAAHSRGTCPPRLFLPSTVVI